MGLFDKLFGTYSERELKKIDKTVNQIEALADKYSAMTDAELSGMTPKFKERLANGETLDDILPDAFAAVREAADRVLGKRPFRVQLIGGIILHQGRIAEMKTGEGKTLVATMPAYLNALTGEGVHIVTVNDYLACRDSEEMGRVYGFMGLTTGIVVHGQSPADKQAAYAADITYGTNNEFGFDYLRDNMVVYKQHLSQRGHNFAIVDEVDSILIDEARTPLIISGAGDPSTDLYTKADTLVRKFKKLVVKELNAKDDNDDVDADYIVDEKAKNAVITPAGTRKAEQFFGIENLSDPENNEIAHHINQAIRAYGTMKRDVDYVVNENGVMIVDAFTGRLMPGRRYSNGLHQAIEAKERVKIEKENQTLATITFQNYFRMYKKLSGMTGTALTEDAEFREIYTLDVVEIPTNKPMVRIDHNDVLYKTINGKYRAIVNKVKECHAKGQPVLVGTVSIDKSEILSKLLDREGIKHTVLNAKLHEKEAEIVAQAGKLGAVTISTNMAGRGTDIMLGGNSEFMAKNEMRKRGYSDELISLSTGTSVVDDEEIMEARRTFAELNKKYKKEIEPEAQKVREAGGLFILGSERHESRRIDNQLRGRSGRQGDPGESCFFLSLEDDLMRLFGGERMHLIASNLGMSDEDCLDFKAFSGVIESSQKKVEDLNFKRRKNVLAYDDVMNKQRELIYKQRQDVLNGADISGKIANMIAETVEQKISELYDADAKSLDVKALDAYFIPLLREKYPFVELRKYVDSKSISERDVNYMTELLSERANDVYKEKEDLFGAENMREIERAVLLRNVDRKWMDHIDAMDDLKGSVGLQGYAQRDPVNEYRFRGADMFDELVGDIRENTARMILCLTKKAPDTERVQIANPITESASGEIAKKKITVVKGEKVGRNDPCPCGSGKKYKNCCGANR
ncbi:MAG: preprotein translocase subunit SecA [Clostridia bacterium]|nr:preprotein translocase subunit SecA [Clostridia bacterium]